MNVSFEHDWRGTRFEGKKKMRVSASATSGLGGLSEGSRR